MNEALPIIERRPLPEYLTVDELERRLADGAAFPVVEDDVCCFAYRGEVIGVRLMHFGVGLPDDLTFEPLDDSDWWLLPLAMPKGTRLEYKLEVEDSYGRHLIDDPLNPHDASHPFGANSVAVAAGYEPPAWTRTDPDIPTGRLVDFVLDSAALGRETRTAVYLPPGFELDGGSRYPLLVVHDGGDYLQYASATTVLDQLSASGAMAPVVVAFTQPGERLVEYADDDRQHRHLTEELVPELERELPLVGAPKGRVVMGCSFGAVASLSAAAAAPGYFGGLLLQSGSFAGVGVGCRPRPEKLWRPVRAFVRSYVHAPAAVADRVAVTCGVFESLICENRALVPVLESTGMEVRFIEQLDGHNWVCWRDSLGLALPWLLG